MVSSFWIATWCNLKGVWDCWHAVMGTISHVWAEWILLKYHGSRGLWVRRPPEESPCYSVSHLYSQINCMEIFTVNGREYVWLLWADALRWLDWWIVHDVLSWSFFSVQDFSHRAAMSESQSWMHECTFSEIGLSIFFQTLPKIQSFFIKVNILFGRLSSLCLFNCLRTMQLSAP